MPNLTPPTPITLGVPQRYPSQVPTTVQLNPTFVLATPVTPPPSQAAPVQDPTQPWKDLEYANMLPVVPQTVRPVFDSAAPVFGFTPGFTVADLPGRASGRKTVLSNITTSTQSATVSAGTNHVDISVALSSANASCTLNVYQVDSVNGNVLIKQYQGVSRFVAGLFVGGQDGIVLAGADLVFEITTITGAATVSVDIEIY